MGQREIRERKRKGEIKGKWDFLAFILNRASEGAKIKREEQGREESWKEEREIWKREISLFRLLSLRYIGRDQRAKRRQRERNLDMTCGDC